MYEQTHPLSQFHPPRKSELHALITLPRPSHPLVPIIAFPELFFDLTVFPWRSSHSQYPGRVSNAILGDEYGSSLRDLVYSLSFCYVTRRRSASDVFFAARYNA